ncbi:hypothetical protein PM082_013656 [Marasmius tenuissimus]|nr:hypothetical protein PM082_013656 [Marasmius tenuissimus]
MGGQSPSLLLREQEFRLTFCRMHGDPYTWVVRWILSVCCCGQSSLISVMENQIVQPHLRLVNKKSCIYIALENVMVMMSSSGGAVLQMIQFTGSEKLVGLSILGSSVKARVVLGEEKGITRTNVSCF